MTILGLPMSLMALTVIAGAFGAVIFIIIEMAWFALPSSVAACVGTWLFLIKKVKDNPHYGRELALPPRFWRATKDHRVLSAGAKR